MFGNEISKQDLYEGVKTLVESEEKHLHLNQHKLYTLYSIGFQYLLYRSTKKPGAYIIRLEDSALANKILKKAKDSSSRKFLQSLLLPRKLKYQKSMFYLDFFHIGTWALTAEIPPEKIQGALIVKNTSDRPMSELMTDENNEMDETLASLPDDYFYSSLKEICPKTITIAYENEFEGAKKISFPFIKKEKEKISGLTVSTEIDLESLD